MKKSESKNTGQSLEKELKRLRKENEQLKSKLMFQKESGKAGAFNLSVS